MSNPTMNLNCKWVILLISLWIQVGFVSGTDCKDGTVTHLSREDVLLLWGEQEPKCFTRTEKDFTCFFERTDNRTYDLLYKVERSSENRCEMSVQTTEEGTFLHIRSFPDSDVLLYADIYIEVVEHNTNTSIYNRTVSVEDNCLLDPPSSVSLDQNGQAGQLRVSWRLSISKYLRGNVIYRIRYSSGQREKTKEVEEGHILDSLIPGEEVEAQVSVKKRGAGHWSSWSHPVRAVVPQSADDISLMCYTSDLHNIICQWNASRYGVENEYRLFYKMDFSEALGWTEWTECLSDRNLTDLCSFHGDKSRKVKVKLSSSSAPLSRTMYSQEFTLNKSIKTSPPNHVSALEKVKLCLKWEAPLPSLSAHLQYEISYQIKESDIWMTVSQMGPETLTCLDVPSGSHYSVKLRAKPIGSIYSGLWSDWSDVFTGVTPIDRSTLLMLCIPISMLITAVILISLFATYLREIKQYFWPPVPNLNKVLQGFLTEINGQKWDPPGTAKQYSEEATSSVVEVMSEHEVSGLNKPPEESTQLLSAGRSFSCTQQVQDSSGAQVFPDYVTLNKDSIIICPKGNKYVYKQVGEKEGPVGREELFQTCPPISTEGSACNQRCTGVDFLNHSYLPLAELAHRPDTRGPGNIYTNVRCS